MDGVAAAAEPESTPPATESAPLGAEPTTPPAKPKPHAAEATPHAAALAAATQRLHGVAARAGDAPIREIEILRRAFNGAVQDSEAEARQEHDRAEAERLARLPTERRKEELKWDLFNATWQGDAKKVDAILQMPGADPDVRQGLGCTPLHVVPRTEPRVASLV
jgi:hypothetical protein